MQAARRRRARALPRHRREPGVQVHSLLERAVVSVVTAVGLKVCCAPPWERLEHSLCPLDAAVAVVSLQPSPLLRLSGVHHGQHAVDDGFLEVQI